MSRFSHLDTDEERLPEGMVRVGYDSDTQTYTFRDADGSLWEGPPGSTYGRLTQVSGPTANGTDDVESGRLLDDNFGPRQPEPWEEEKASWRQAWAPLLNFFVLVGLFLIGVIWLLYSSKGSSSKGVSRNMMKLDCRPDDLGYEIAKGDTCLGIARAQKYEISDVLDANPGLECDKLPIGGFLCLPPKG